uniref:Zinc finger protein unc-98 n=1 Tax=Heligmosomoides polygyrus TaxID=6339 RepID=A0A183FZJ4_HELPZ
LICFFFLSIDLFILAIGLAAPVLQTEQLLLLQSVHFDVFLYAYAKGYKCECGRTFFSYTEMLYHKHPEDIEKEKEDKVRKWDGDMPTPAFIEQGFEPKHPMKVYSDVRSKPYICEYCSKSYADSRQLAYHMYSHRGERQFNPRSSRYLMGRTGVGYTDRNSYYLFPRTSGYVTPMY